MERYKHKHIFEVEKLFGLVLMCLQTKRHRAEWLIIRVNEG